MLSNRIAVEVKLVAHPVGGSGAFVLKDLLPRYASQCAWVVARLPVHVVTLLKSSELARGV